jgi:predicted AAA+ superfamily ATPase
LLSNIGKETTYTSLKNAFQIGSTNTVVDYLSWLEDAYLLFFLQKFSWSAKSISVNPRKVYAIDNGLINANSLSFSKDKGRILENAVYIYLRNNGVKMYYFKEKNECDFVLFDKEKCTKALQVCYEINGDNKTREINGLLEAMLFFNLNEGFIITQNQKDTLKIEEKTIYLIPAFEYFMQ